MNTVIKTIKFSGLRGEVEKYDFTTEFEAFYESEKYEINPIGNIENGFMIDFTSIMNDDNEATLRVIQRRGGYESPPNDRKVKLRKRIDNIDISILNVGDDTLFKGETYQCEAIVTGSKNVSQEVEWEIVDDSMSVIDLNSGKLEIDKEENLESFTIKATSVEDKSKSKIKHVTIKSTPIVIFTVSIIPTSVTIQKPGEQKFEVFVSGQNPDPEDFSHEEVEWKIENQTVDSTIDENGLLKIGKDETAESINVIAISKVDPTKKSEPAIVNITEPIIIDEKNYLKMFTANTPSDVGYYDMSKFDNEYPTFKNFWKLMPGNSDMNLTPPVPRSFYDGINYFNHDVNDEDSDPPPQVLNTDSDFRKKMFKLLIDTNNGLIIPELQSYSSGIATLNNIGITDKIQQHEILLTYACKSISFIYNSWSPALTEEKLGDIIELAKKMPLYTCTWYSYCRGNNNNNGNSGMAWGPYTWTISTPTLTSHIWLAAWMTTRDQPIDDYMKHFYQPYQWKGNKESIIKWSEAMGNANDPLTNDYEVSDFDYTNSTICSRLWIRTLFAHETGHTIAFYNKYSGGAGAAHDMEEWYNIGGWNSINKETGITVNDYISNLSGNTEPPPTRYGCTNPAEDFAECFTMYIVNEKYLKEKYPKKYAFIKNYLNKLKEVIV